MSIAYGPNVLRAPQIQYQHPAADAGTKIGTFRASGPGTLSYMPDVNKPDQVFQAEWQASVELGRHNGQPVLTVAGRPRLSVTEHRACSPPTRFACFCARWKSTARRSRFPTG